MARLALFLFGRSEIVYLGQDSNRGLQVWIHGLQPLRLSGLAMATGLYPSNIRSYSEEKVRRSNTIET